jgi:hypothetical protein
MIFIDEMPVYVNEARKYGWARSSRRPVHVCSPASHMSCRAQIVMACTAQAGVVYGKCFGPKKPAGQRKADEWDVWGPEAYRAAVQAAVGAVVNSIGARVAENAHIVLVTDNSPDHGGAAAEAAALAAIQATHRVGKLELRRAAPVSPHLNLQEYYNRILRVRINRARVNHGATLADPCRKKKFNCLIDIVEREIAQLIADGSHDGGLRALMNATVAVVRDKGHLRWDVRY